MSADPFHLTVFRAPTKPGSRDHESTRGRVARNAIESGRFVAVSRVGWHRRLARDRPHEGQRVMPWKFDIASMARGVALAGLCFFLPSSDTAAVGADQRG